MKKLFLLLSMLFLVVYAFAQKEKFGLKVGFALPNSTGADFKADSFNINYFNSLEYTPTLSGGFYINTKAGTFVWFKHEANYINRGYNFADDSTGTSLRVNQHYIDVYPFNATFHLKGAQLFAGPSISFLAIKTQERINSSGKIVVDRSDLAEEGRNIAELGFIAGVEYEIFFGLNIGARYIRGLTSQYQKVEGAPQARVYNETWLFSIGFTFGANKKPETTAID